jgi:hypothetical protein
VYRALIICNYRFPEANGSLDDLQGPKKDGLLLRDALTDHETGMFDKANVLHPLNDAPSGEILVAVEEFFGGAEPDDTLLFYYSGHGRTLGQQLYLCAHNTNPARLRSTAVPGNLLNEIVESSLAKAKILVLDCCYSAMFKGDDEAEIAELFGTGRYVLAATSAIERAADGAQKGLPSPFTKAFAEALTGKAEDLDGDGMVDLDDIYRYLKAVAFERSRPHQNFEGAGTVHIAKRPVTARRRRGEARPQGDAADSGTADLSGDIVTYNYTFHSPSTDIPYLDRPAPGAFFNPELVAEFRAAMRDDARVSMPDSLADTEFLELAGLIQNGSITYAGVLLFGSRPTALLPTAVVQCARFHGTTNTAPHDAIIDLHDAIPQLIEQAHDFVARVARVGEAPTDKGPRAEPVYRYPMVALREIIANAVVHRDYEDQASSVQIFAFEDRIEVLSPGAWHGAPVSPGERPLGGLARRSQRRNFRIAQALSWSHLFEGLGTGVARSVENCERVGAPEPLVVIDEDSVRVTIFPQPHQPMHVTQPEQKVGHIGPQPQTYLLDERTEASFLSSYRRHLIDRHGMLEPPDFERRRRVPVADIYVPTIITPESLPGRAAVRRSGAAPGLDIYQLAERLDRSVLLGDPGGGKTTAANVLMHHFAVNPQGPVPFLVTLREYATGAAPQRSVAGHIEGVLSAFYQVSPPPGLVELLLLNGRAVVIFEGLDELLDVGQRADITSRVEHFCAEYPLVPVLVTSRVVGYDEARLDDRQFTCYRLSGFGDDQVAEYARKWFSLDAGARPDDADWFVAESASVSDLRSNPLLLSLMCILYRGEGSLPRNRAEVYQQCANLLFRRWDARRRIGQELRAGHLVEPALRHIATSLFAQDQPQPTITERALVDTTAQFLHYRGFESEDDARSAAGELADFCRGRMWVFTDVGSTATGQRLYAFTHRTFLEYFAAEQIAYNSDTPEQLATALLPYIERSETWAVAELAVQLKDRTTERGAARIYAEVLRVLHDQSPVALPFLALCLRSVDPSPHYVRELTRQLFAATCAAQVDISADSPLPPAWRELTSQRGVYREVIADEIDAAVAAAVGSGREDLIVNSLRLLVSLCDALPASSQAPGHQDREVWAARADACLTAHGPIAIGAARADAYVRHGAVRAGLISVRQALGMPGGPGVLFRPAQGAFRECAPYFAPVLSALYQGWPAFGQAAVAADLDAFGTYLIDHREPPWLELGSFDVAPLILDSETQRDAFDERPPPLTQAAYLGAAALLLIMEEAQLITTWTGRQLGPLRHLAPYLTRRRGVGQGTELPSLMVTEEFKPTFRDWADGRINASGH